METRPLLHDVADRTGCQMAHVTSLAACEDDAATEATLAAVLADGTCYVSGTTWRGRRGIRISVCNGRTSEADVDRSIEALAAAARAVAA